MSSAFPRRSCPRPGLSAGASPARVGGTEVFAPISHLAALAGDLAERPLGPEIAFRTALRARLVEEATLQGAVVPAPRSEARSSSSRHSSSSLRSPSGFRSPPARSRDVPRVRAGRRVARRVTAAGLLLVLSGGGITAAAASAALPGDPLYGVKRLTESVRLHTAHGSSPEADARFVSYRLAEAERLAARAGAAGVSGTSGASRTSEESGTSADSATRAATVRWAEFDRVVGEAGTALARLQAEAPDATALATLADQRSRWEALVSAVPVAQRGPVQRVVGLLATMTGTLPGTGATAGAPDTADITDTADTADTEAAAADPAVDAAGGADTAIPGDAVLGTNPSPAGSGSAQQPADNGSAAASGNSAHGLPAPGTGSSGRAEGTGAPGTSGSGGSGSGGFGSGAGSTSDQRPRLPLPPRRDGVSSPTGAGASSWDGGPAVLERTSDALTRLFPTSGGR